MKQSAVLLFTAALLSPTGAEQWQMSEIKECVKTSLDGFLANFKGSAACPETCGECLADPMACLTDCANNEAACGCAQAIPAAVDTVSECCSHVWGIFEGACRRGMDGLGRTVTKTIANICEAEEELSAAMAGQGPTVLLAKTKDAVQEGALAVLAGFEAAAANHPGAGALLELMPQKAGAKEEEQQQTAAAFVESHSMGSACLGMLEAIESEHAATAESDMPDLRAAAVQIAESAAGFLGKDLPSLIDKVHKAMAVTWSEEGPGMDAEGICEVILRHHDSL